MNTPTSAPMEQALDTLRHLRNSPLMANHHAGLDAAIAALSQPAASQETPWRTMRSAPKDGTAIMVLVEASDIPLAVRWRDSDDARFEHGAGWYMTWDDTFVEPHDGPRYWAPIGPDPDDTDHPHQPSATGGDVEMVPRAALDEVARERDGWMTDLKTARKHANGEVWYWQGDGEDHLESLTDSLPVVIRADQLRALLDPASQPVGAERGGDAGVGLSDDQDNDLGNVIAMLDKIISGETVTSSDRLFDRSVRPRKMTIKDAQAVAAPCANILRKLRAALAAQPAAQQGVNWVVNDLGELGVCVNGRYYFLYKGASIEYGAYPDTRRDGVALHDDGTPMMVRIVGKPAPPESAYPDHFGQGVREFVTATPQPARQVDAPYGYCPECGALGVMRERRPGGDDKCANGHSYPSRNAHKAQQVDKKGGEQ